MQADGSGTFASVAQAKVDEITAAGGEATAVMADVTNPDDCDQIIQTCVDTYGQIGFAITVAGILRDRATWNMTDAEFDAVLNVHLKGTFDVGRAASRVLRQQRHGSLVTVTSVAHEGNFGQANYAAAKGAIASLTYTWAIELGRYGVTVNSVSPTAWTRLIATVPGATAPVPDEMPPGSPMGPPEGVAPLFAYLVSDEARWITGQIIGLGGERLTLFQHPREKLIIMQRGGYTLADLQPGDSGDIPRAVGPVRPTRHAILRHGGAPAAG